jgi:hypothetical protein
MILHVELREVYAYMSYSTVRLVKCSRLRWALYTSRKGGGENFVNNFGEEKSWTVVIGKPRRKISCDQLYHVRSVRKLSHRSLCWS